MAERISTPSKTKEIIEANRFAFKKNFGQNFLIDSNILDNIAACAGVTKEDCVLEIGPGIGSLTQVLAENAGQVVAVEIDNTLIPILKQTLADYDNIEILNQDILKTDIDAIIREKNDGRPIKVVANLPYYITTPIIMDLLENERHVDSITVMVQKEVAERMQARPKEKEYGALSIAVQYYCDAKLDMIVQPACFMPRPKVASAVITLKVLPERKVKTADEKLFFHLVKCAFWLGYAGARGSIGLRGICRTDRQNRTKKSKHIIKNQETSSETDEVSDCRQSNSEVAEGLGKQIRFPNGIRSRNSFPTRKTASFEAFKLMELVCLFFCLSKSKS